MAPLPDPTTRAPTHPDILRVAYTPGFHLSSAHTLVDLPAGAVFAKLTFPPLTTNPEATWATVQSGKNSHINLNSDLVYCNHSCKPTLEFDMEKMEIRVARDCDNGGIKEGDELTFFYPSSEWDMSQGFDCKCGKEQCRGYIGGAKKLGREKLKGYWLNKHIEELFDEEEKQAEEKKDEEANGAAANGAAANGAAAAANGDAAPAPAEANGNANGEEKEEEEKKEDEKKEDEKKEEKKKAKHDKKKSCSIM